MEAVNIRIGPLEFDHADYDAEGDVLYLHVGQPSPAKAKKPRKDMLSASRQAPSESSA
ncbi:MAG: hypothetical protein JOZ98_11750 [Solirubrobacterales bacterium]|nr:hypothetical protein [Solirubrobacterales bacterium]